MLLNRPLHCGFCTLYNHCPYPIYCSASCPFPSNSSSSLHVAYKLLQFYPMQDTVPSLHTAAHQYPHLPTATYHCPVPTDCSTPLPPICLLQHTTAPCLPTAAHHSPHLPAASHHWPLSAYCSTPLSRVCRLKHTTISTFVPTPARHFHCKPCYYLRQ
jgi:hypothetical protein